MCRQLAQLNEARVLTSVGIPFQRTPTGFLVGTVEWPRPME